MDTGKAKDVPEAVAMEYVAVVVIQITPKIPGTVLISKIFLGILAVPIGMLFRETIRHMITVNAAVQRLVADVVTAVYEGDVVMEDDGRFQKLKLIS